MALVKVSQKLPLRIEVKTLKGNNAKTDGAPVWACSDETVGTVAADPSGMSAVFTSVAEGACSITVTVDADLGQGVKPIMGSLDVQVVSDEAAIVTIVAGDPVDA